MMTLAEFQQTQLPLVEAELTDFLKQHTTDPRLAESMLYSVAAGGKRIRPLILLAVVASFRKELTAGVYQCGAALEMVHTYSLIHDDLPAMDDDALRRGKPTNHVVYGEALAILAGDGLLTAAFQLLSQAQLANDEKLLLLQLLAEKAGSQGMVAGQAADIQGEHRQLTLEELEGIHRRKTGDLLLYAFVAGGILAHQPEAVLQQLQQLALHVGLAFQIRDDLLDITATAEEIGKNTHKDQLAGKNTYPSLLGFAEAQQALTAELDAAEQLLLVMGQQLVFEPALLQEILLKLRM